MRVNDGEVRHWADRHEDPELDKHVKNAEFLTFYLSDPENMMFLLSMMDSKELVAFLEKPFGVTDATELRKLVMAQWNQVSTTCKLIRAAIASAFPNSQPV